MAILTQKEFDTLAVTTGKGLPLTTSEDAESLLNPALTGSSPTIINKEDTKKSATTTAQPVTVAETGSVIDYIPIDNVLFDYPSYTYGISLQALSINTYNDLIKDNKNLGKTYKPQNVLIASAGRGGVNFESFPRNSEFDVDFYFDDLKMTTVIGLNQQSRMTNAIQLSFTVIEPYGVTLLNRLIKTAESLGVNNYISMPYLLQIDFFGIDDNGKPTKISDITKYIPIQFVGFKIKVTTKGAEYQIDAVPFNHIAFSETAVTVPVLFEVTAKTVGEFFNSSSTDSSKNYEATVGEKVKAASLAKENQELEDQRAGRLAQKNVNVRDTNIVILDTKIKSNKEFITQHGSTLNAKSFPAAFNAWLSNLVVSGCQDYADSIEVVLDKDIAEATVSIPQIQPATANPMGEAGEGASSSATPFQGGGGEIGGGGASGSFGPSAIPTSNETPTTSATPFDYKPKSSTAATQLERMKLLENAGKAAGMKGNELAMFMAECDHETGSFTNLGTSFPKSYFDKYDPPSSLAKGHGNTQPGDGYLYRGRGFIQIFGKNNYQEYSKILGLDLLDNPDSASEPSIASAVAVKFWQKNCSALSLQNDVDGVSKKIEGPKASTGSLADRRKRYAHYLSAYSIQNTPQGTTPPPTPSAQIAVNKAPPNATSGTVNYPINQGKTAVDVISDVVRNSSFILKQIGSAQYNDIPTDAQEILNKSKLKALRWFKIVPEVILCPFDNTRNEYSKHIIYHVNSYWVYNAKIAEAPLATPKGAVKNYNYIFTGQNRDVLDFTLDFDTTFFVARTGIEQNAKQSQMTTQETPQTNKQGNKALSSVAIAQDWPAWSRPGVQRLSADPRSHEALAIDPRAKIASDLLRSLLQTSRGDMLQLDLKIIGDPDFIKQDDIFYSPTNMSHAEAPTAKDSSDAKAKTDNRTANHSLIMDQGELHVNVLFQTASDYGENGIASPHNLSNTKYNTSVFSGTYKIAMVESHFHAGKFEQVLSMYRIYTQPDGITLGQSASSQNQSANAARDLPTTNTLVPSTTVTVPATVNIPEDTGLLNLNQIANPQIFSTTSTLLPGLNNISTPLISESDIKQISSGGVADLTSIVPNSKLRNDIKNAATKTINKL